MSRARLAANRGYRARIQNDWSIETADFTASVDNGYLVDLSGAIADVTVTLPVGLPSEVLSIGDIEDTIRPFKIIVQADPAQNIEGVLGGSIEITKTGDMADLAYVDNTIGWKRMASAPESVPTITVSATQPTDPMEGDIWFETL